MEEDKVTYIGQAKDGTLAFFRGSDGVLLIDYVSNRVDEFLNGKYDTMRTYDKDGVIDAELHSLGMGGMHLAIKIPCLNGRSIGNATVEDLLYAIKEELISPVNFKLGKTMEGIFKLFLVREMM